ncbi:MAG TPA: indolepyruvate oxidoreductase subunit beta family protein [Alphaproteobacteria bacterium]|nr:indolepyruvate oxidoreductase subunit beta family protein [Alphaproteobacteria bacterium]
MTALAERPITVLIAALGGEGGGVLANWVVAAAVGEGYPVQSTSIPGVAQRTGATTYYIEIFPTKLAALGARRPVLALTPNPGNIDMMVASELIEAGRAMQNGYVSPARTTLIASTHRVYATSEKMQMGDGRFDDSRIVRAAAQLARKAVLFDMGRAAQASGSVINAVLFGAMVGSGEFPLARAACEAAIRGGGKAVEANLRGFAAGHDLATGVSEEPAPVSEKRAWRATLKARVRGAFPAETHRILEEGAARLVDYQDDAYAALYLDRLVPVFDLDSADDGWRLTAETGRHLALWMSYEDVIRVADLKTRPTRFARVRREVGAKPSEPIAVVEYLKPGLDEICAILPSGPARALRTLATRLGLADRLSIGMYVKTSAVLGFAILRLLAALRSWRRRSSRFAEEQARIEAWLAEIRRVAAHDRTAALEIAECARLIKGYGDTHRRGWDSFRKIFATLVEGRAPDARTLAAARQAALADPEGDALARTLAESAAAPAKAATILATPVEPRLARAGE